MFSTTLCLSKPLTESSRDHDSNFPTRPRKTKKTNLPRYHVPWFTIVLNVVAQRNLMETHTNSEPKKKKTETKGKYQPESGQ